MQGQDGTDVQRRSRVQCLRLSRRGRRRLNENNDADSRQSLASSLTSRRVYSCLREQAPLWHGGIMASGNDRSMCRRQHTDRSMVSIVWHSVHLLRHRRTLADSSEDN